MNDGETSKYNNQQGIHNHWTCQCTLLDLATSKAGLYPRPGGRPLLPCEDGRTFRIAFHSWYLCPSGRIDQGYASVAKRLQHGRQPDHRWPQRGGRQIPRMFPYSGAISTAPSYNDPGLILTGGTPAARRGNIGVVSLQYRLPSAALLPLHSTSPGAGL